MPPRLFIPCATAKGTFEGVRVRVKVRRGLGLGLGFGGAQLRAQKVTVPLGLR